MEEIYKKSEIISSTDTFIFIYFVSQYLLLALFLRAGRGANSLADNVFRSIHLTRPPIITLQRMGLVGLFSVRLPSNIANRRLRRESMARI